VGTSRIFGDGKARSIKPLNGGKVGEKMEVKLHKQYVEFDDHCLIDAIKRAMPGQEMAEQYTGVTFKRKGRRLWACCPIHGEKTPSLMLDERGKMRCFGCGWFGDVLDFIGAIRGTPLADTIKMLAGDLGLMRDTPPQERQRIRHKIQQERAERQQIEQFIQAVNDAFIKLAAVGRAAQAVINSIKSEADLDRSEVVAAFDVVCLVDWFCEDLGSDDAERQYEALKRARNGGLL
jgi:hypothetical protein